MNTISYFHVLSPLNQPILANVAWPESPHTPWTKHTSWLDILTEELDKDISRMRLNCSQIAENWKDWGLKFARLSLVRTSFDYTRNRFGCQVCNRAWGTKTSLGTLTLARLLGTHCHELDRAKAQITRNSRKVSGNSSWLRRDSSWLKFVAMRAQKSCKCQGTLKFTNLCLGSIRFLSKVEGSRPSSWGNGTGLFTPDGQLPSRPF